MRTGPVPRLALLYLEALSAVPKVVQIGTGRHPPFLAQMRLATWQVDASKEMVSQGLQAVGEISAEQTSGSPIGCTIQGAKPAPYIVLLFVIAIVPKVRPW